MDGDGKDDFFLIFIIESTNDKEKKKEKKKDGRVSDWIPFTLCLVHPFSSNVLNETFPFLTSGTWVFNPIAVSKAMSNKEPRFQAHRSLSRATAVFTLLPRYAPFFLHAITPRALFPRHLTLRYSLSSLFLFISPVISSNLCFRKKASKERSRRDLNPIVSPFFLSFFLFFLFFFFVANDF